MNPVLVVKAEQVIMTEQFTGFPFIWKEYDDDGDICFHVHFRTYRLRMTEQGIGAMQSMMWPRYRLDVVSQQHESNGAYPSAALRASSKSQPYIHLS